MKIPPILRAFLSLAIAQVIGWGTLGLPAVLGRQMAADLDMPVATIFAGTSVLYVVMGLWAPVLGQAFVRFGARRVMIAGTLLAVPGFGLLASAGGQWTYFLAWAVLGTSGSATLTTPAYICLSELAGSRAKSAIGALMLVTGLSSSLFWPTTAALSATIDWRSICLVYAALTLLVCLPAYVFGLPRRAMETETVKAATERMPTPGRAVFPLIVTAISLNAFITFGFSAVLIELLKAEGLPPAEAVAFGSVLGVVQVSARAMDLLGGRRWDGVTTGLVAGIALPVAMLILWLGHGAYWSIAGFILCYGLGSGALAVARATIPLVFYDTPAFAKATSRIALPLNLMSALSPPLLAGLLSGIGSSAVLALASLLSCGALMALGLLRRLRPQPLSTRP